MIFNAIKEHLLANKTLKKLKFHLNLLMLAKKAESFLKINFNT